jgi:hypothetical protein
MEVAQELGRAHDSHLLDHPFEPVSLVVSGQLCFFGLPCWLYRSRPDMIGLTTAVLHVLAATFFCLTGNLSIRPVSQWLERANLSLPCCSTSELSVYVWLFLSVHSGVLNFLLAGSTLLHDQTASRLGMWSSQLLEYSYILAKPSVDLQLVSELF